MTRVRILSELAAWEVEQDLTRTRDRLCAVLPALVVASVRYEEGDGILTEPVRVVAQVIGALEAAAGLIADVEPQRATGVDQQQ